MKLQCPIPRILIPIDGSKHSMRAVKFAGSIGYTMGKSLSNITLLHVLTGGYISDHMANIDFRTEIIKESDLFKKIKQEFIEKNVNPFIEEAKAILKQTGVEASIESKILEGDPANVILKIAEENNYSAIIMGRRGLSLLKGIFLGSVTSKVLHKAKKQTVFIVGKKLFKDKVCPVPKILIPVDGSSYSFKGVEYVACLTAPFKELLMKVTLLRVINIALYTERLKMGIDPEEDSRNILSKAKGVFVDSDFPENIIEELVTIGDPVSEIIRVAENGGYNLIVLGRKGRGALKDLLIGGVSSSVVQRCQNQTVAVVNI